MEVDQEDLIDCRLRKYLAPHQYPFVFKNESDPKFIKEVQSFLRTVVKPTINRSLVLQDMLDDDQLMFHRDNPSVEIQTRRLTELLIKCYGKEKVSTNATFFC